MPRGKKDREEKAKRAREDRKLLREVKEAVKPAKDVTPCPVCDGKGKPGGCNLCGQVE